MNAKWTKRIYAIHRWSGLIAGVNVLILSLTGAFLLFGEDIEHWLRGIEHTHANQAPTIESQEAPAYSLDYARQQLNSRYPDGDIVRIRFAQEESLLHEFRLSFESIPGETEFLTITFNPYTGELLEQAQEEEASLSNWVLQLHADLFLGTGGTLLIGIAGLLLLVSSITGLIVYFPYTKTLTFGLIRWNKPWQIITGDWHKLIGIASLAFNVIIAFTGVAITLGFLAAQIWVLGNVKQLTGGAPKETAVIAASLDAVYTNAQKTLKGSILETINFPADLQGEHHFLIFARNEGTFAEFLPVVALAEINESASVTHLALPWWLKIVAISAPVHFGAYGGWPVKLIYTLFGLTSGLLSISGFYLFVKKRKKKKIRSEVPIDNRSIQST